MGCHEIVRGHLEVPVWESDGLCSKVRVWGWGRKGGGTALCGTEAVHQSQFSDLYSHPAKVEGGIILPFIAEEPEAQTGQETWSRPHS